MTEHKFLGAKPTIHSSASFLLSAISPSKKDAKDEDVVSVKKNCCPSCANYFEPEFCPWCDEKVTGITGVHYNKCPKAHERVKSALSASDIFGERVKNRKGYKYWREFVAQKLIDQFKGGDEDFTFKLADDIFVRKLLNLKHI